MNIKPKNWWVTVLVRTIGCPDNYITKVISEHPARWMTRLRSAQAVNENFHLLSAIEIPITTWIEMQSLKKGTEF